MIKELTYKKPGSTQETRLEKIHNVIFENSHRVMFENSTKLYVHDTNFV